jgi:hypothetical protein
MIIVKYLLVIAVLLSLFIWGFWSVFSYTAPDKAQAGLLWGSTKCGEWLELKTDSQIISQYEDIPGLAWLFGYLSGRSLSINKEFHVPGSGLSTEQIHFWMDKYCRENPSSSIRQGADILFRERTGY